MLLPSTIRIKILYFVDFTIRFTVLYTYSISVYHQQYNKFYNL
jgi:hypothetical protein